jgi:serine/threonine protein kinase
MNESCSELEPVGQLAESFLARYRRGERPSLSEYTDAHPQLATQIRELFPALAVLEELGSVEGPAANLLAGSLEDKAQAPQPLGDFQLVREIGRGGMGVVYEAVQISLGRRVALKVLPFAAALDPKQLQRFKNEAQAAAHLQHTNIVPVHYVGCERGVHFYAMQFIEGQTLAAVIGELRQQQRDQKSETGERSGVTAPSNDIDPQHTGPYSPPQPAAASPPSPLSTTPPAAALSTERSIRSPTFFRTVAELGVQAAAALEHAHQLGVVHRDIKPANLLYDAGGRLWITDFGLARCQGQAGLTMSGDLVGTLRYMSPEQALAQHGAVDARTDVYSLGVTLYELLTLEPAYNGRSREEVLRQIAFDEPKSPRRLNNSIPAELETIVLKTMEKNPAERYATAQELADDLERFLKDEPIRARRRTVVHRVRKWARRHRPVVATLAGVVVVLLLAGTAGGLWYAEREGSRAEQESALRREAEEGKQAAETNERDALREKQIAQAVRNFLQHDLLLQADAAQQANARRQAGGGFEVMENPTIKELLDRAAAELTPGKIEAKFLNQPEVQASILKTIGDAYRGTGAYVSAVEFLKRSSDIYRQVSGPEHSDTLFTLNCLAQAHLDAGQTGEAIALLEQVRDARLKTLASDHPDSLRARNNVATAYLEAGKTDEAIALLEPLRDAYMKHFGPDHDETLEHLDNLAHAYLAAGKTTDAVALFEQVRDAKVKNLGAEHPFTLVSLNNLAHTYLRAGKAAEGIALLEQVRDVKIKELGADHPSTLNTLFNLGQAYLLFGKTAEAIALLEQVRDSRSEKLGVDHPAMLEALSCLGAAYTRAGKTAEAIPLLEQMRDAKLKKLGPDHPGTVITLSSLGQAYLFAGKPDEAIRIFEQVRDTRVKILGADHPDTLTTLSNLGVAYREAGKLDQALPLLQQAAAGIEKGQFIHHSAGSIVDNLSDCHERLKQYEAAEAWRRKWLAVLKERAGPESAAYVNTLAGVGLNLLRQQRYAEAEQTLRDCLVVLEKKAPNGWTKFFVKSMLGDAVLGQMRYAESEPLLKEGYEGMRQSEAKLSPWDRVRLSEALHRLVKLYDAWGKKDLADAWRKRSNAQAAQAPLKK